MKQTKNVPQLRFSGFDDDWEEKKLGNVSDRVTRKNENLESTLPLTISAQYGLVDQITFFNNQIASTTNLRNYFLVKNGEFAYNKSYSAGYPWGAIKRLDRYEKGVLSTLYIVFKPKNINSDYLLSYYDTDKWYKQVSEIAAEGARNHGLLNIAPNDFFQTTFVAPMSEIEQQKIGAFLSHVDSLIQAKTKKLESLKAVKKSLLQKCFPKAGEKVPEIRFAGFSGDWEEKKLTDEVELYSGLTYTPKDVEEYGTLVLRSSNVQNGEIELEDNVFVDPKVVNSKNVEKGDIIVVVRNGSRALIGKHAQIKTTMHNTVIGAFMTGIKAPNPEFMNALLSTDAFTREVEINLGATINQITNSTFESMSFYFPKTIEEQQALGSFFSKYDSLVSAQQKEIDKLKDIKKSLLQKMFV